MNLLKGLDLALNLPEDDDERRGDEEDHRRRARPQPEPQRSPPSRTVRGMSIGEDSDAILFS
jgi:hypothetical protein